MHPYFSSAILIAHSSLQFEKVYSFRHLITMIDEVQTKRQKDKKTKEQKDKKTNKQKDKKTKRLKGKRQKGKKTRR